MLNHCFQYLWKVFLLISLLPCIFADNNSCGPGLSLPGGTYPQGDLNIEHGNPLEIFCSLNPIHSDSAGRTSSDLVFYHDDKPVPHEFVNVVNSTTIRLFVEKPPASKTMYYCKLHMAGAGTTKGKLIPVCLNSVAIAYKPLEVLNFECVSHNWENLNCSWKQPKNYVKTVYSLHLRLPGRAGGRVLYKCPDDLDIKTDSCFWNMYTNPLYRQPYEYYYFTITGENHLGNVTFPLIKFHHYSHVIPNAPLNLFYLNGTMNSVYLSWRVSPEMANFPPGIIHRVKYQSVWDSLDHWDEFPTTHLNVKSPSHVLNITGLKYANTLYDVKVYMKSAVAPIGDDKWSIPANLTVKTKPAVPGSAPKTDIGSFEVSGGLTNRDVYIYWQHIPESMQNGDNFEYRVYKVAESGRELLVTPTDSSKAYAMLKGIDHNSYRFYIVSANKEGRSHDRAEVYIPSRGEIPPEPNSFTKIAYENGDFELSWKPPKPSNFTIESYTIFWCDNDRDRPYQCKGFLNWTHVSPKVNITKMKMPTDKLYQFAISANTKMASSGMVWASCTVMHNKVVGKMKYVWMNSIGSTKIVVGWKLDCSDRVGIVTGYRIFYCPIVSPHNLTCKEPVKNTTIRGDPSTPQGEVVGLRPYTTYLVTVAVETRNGIGYESDPLFNTTLEATPEQPEKVVIKNVTNSSITVRWQNPVHLNGVVRFYEVHYNEHKKKIDSLPNSTTVTLDHLRSYFNYSISVVICTVSCSERSPPVIVQTAIGAPDIMDRPVVKFLNTSQVLVSWKPPEHSAGSLDFYQIMVVQKGGDSNSSKYIFNTTELNSQIPIPNCESEGSTLMYKFSVRGVNIGPNNVSYNGPWSVANENSCVKLPVSQFVTVMIWVFGSLAVTGICIVFGYMGKRLWSQCKLMQDVEVKLPPGLAPMGERDKDQEYHKHVHSWPKSDDRDLRIQSAADEELLLAKKEDRHGRNPSGDSSGCSSGHESVSSSLTSGTHMSSDSGTEVDQRAASPSGDCVFADSPSSWGELNNSLRQRNVSSRTEPYVKMGSASVVARSTPNLSDLPENVAAGACMGGWSSAGYISMPSSEEMSHHVSDPNADLGYCRVGLETGDPVSGDVLLEHRPAKGYVSLASVIDTSSSPSSSSLGPAYVAHLPKDPVTKAYVAVPPNFFDRPEVSRDELNQPYCRMGLHPGTKPAGSGYVSLSDDPRAEDGPKGGGYVPHARFADEKDANRKPEELYIRVFAPGASDTASKSPTTSV